MKTSHPCRPGSLFSIKVVSLVAAIRLGLWFVSFRKIQAWVNRLTCPQVDPQISQLTPDQIAGAVERISRYIPRATCLTQALTTQILLGRCGHSSSLTIGVARNEKNQFRAHAWVKHNDQVIIGGTEDSLKQYTALSAHAENSPQRSTR